MHQATQQIGTKERWRSWLRAAHQLTWSKYTTLPVELKLKLWKQYRQGLKPEAVR